MNITEVTFNGAKRTTTKRLYQYDYGQILQFTDLELPEEFECDFAVDRCGNSETYLGENNQIQIPNKYLTTGNAVVGYIYLHTGEDDGETVYIFTVPVSPRPERNDPVPSTEQKSRIDTLIEQMDEAVQTAEASAESAQQSAEEAQAVIADIGDTVEQAVEDYMETHPVDVPVDSVNGKTGNVVLTASDVGALPDSTVIPSKTSQLQNDSGYLTAVPSEYVTEQELKVETDRATAAEASIASTVTMHSTAIGALQRDMQTAQSDISAETTRATQAESSIRSEIPTSAQISALAPVQSVNGMTGAVTIPTATTSSAGLMSSTDKGRLDALYADYSSAMTALGV